MASEHHSLEHTAELSSESRIVIEPRKRLFELDLAIVWHYREMLYFLVWRDIKVRYKQTAIGISWALIQPLLTMLLFAAVFGIFAKMPSDGVPYPLFAYSALIPWTYFSQSLNRCGNSLIGEAELVRKVYFPRLIMPLSAVTAPLLDLVLSFLIIFVMYAWYHVIPTTRLLVLPLFVLLALMTALAIGLWLAALNVRYRDVVYTIPFMIQVLMYASPIAYPLSIVPVRLKFFYSLNPLVGVVEGFRWAILGRNSPDLMAIALSATLVVIILAGGIIFFRKMERTFADIV